LHCGGWLRFVLRMPWLPVPLGFAQKEVWQVEGLHCVFVALYY
jgi:hypothetical protein